MRALLGYYLVLWLPNPDRLSLSETVSDGQVYWGGRLLKVTEAPSVPSEWLEIIRRV